MEEKHNSILLKVNKIYSSTKGIKKENIIWIKDGKIKEFFFSEKKIEKKIKDSSIVIEFPKDNVYPGFIEAHSHLGVAGEGVGEIGKENNEYSNPITPHLKIKDCINLNIPDFKIAQQEGIVGITILPGSGNLIGGQGVIIKTTGNTYIIEERIINHNIGIKMALGENPKKIHKDKCFTRMGQVALIRGYLEEVKKYKNKRKKENIDNKIKAGLNILNKTYPVRFHAHTISDIQAAINLSNEFGFNLVIEHCTEGHFILDLLEKVKNKVQIVYGPLLVHSVKAETRNKILQAPAILSKLNITLALTTDAPVSSIALLRHLAGMSIKGGMKYQEALKSITYNSAKICRIEDRFGDIKKDMEAHLVVWEGDPLKDIQAQVKLIIDKDKLYYL